MGTHAIAADTRNFTVNIPKDEDAIWGRLAMGDSRSKGDLWKELVLEGLRRKFPADADAIARIRSERRGRIASAVCLAVALLITWQWMVTVKHDDDWTARRGKRSRTLTRSASRGASRSRTDFDGVFTLDLDEPEAEEVA